MHLQNCHNIFFRFVAPLDRMQLLYM